jgi:hypothetical protein
MSYVCLHIDCDCTHQVMLGAAVCSTIHVIIDMYIINISVVFILLFNVKSNRLHKFSSCIWLLHCAIPDGMLTVARSRKLSPVFGPLSVWQRMSKFPLESPSDSVYIVVDSDEVRWGQLRWAGWHRPDGLERNKELVGWEKDDIGPHFVSIIRGNHSTALL